MTRDRVATTAAVLAYSIALGVAQVMLPLLALASGYSAVAVGILAAASGAAQLAARAAVGWFLRYLSDRAMMSVAAGVLAAASLLVVASVSLWPMVGSHVLQGVSRGLYWSGSQVHAVRGRASSLRGIAGVNAVASFGMMVGPLVAGLLAQYSLRTALAAAAGLVVASGAAHRWLDRHPPTGPSSAGRAASVWTRSQVRLGCSASGVAGAWNALLASYVPVLLVQGDQSPATVGVLVAVASSAQVAGSVLVVRAASPRSWLGISSVAAGVALAVLPALAGVAPAAGAVLAVSGLGAGVLLTLGPALASHDLADAEKARAVAATGTARAAALLVVPASVAAAAIAVPVSVGVGVVGTAMALTAAAARAGAE